MNDIYLRIEDKRKNLKKEIEEIKRSFGLGGYKFYSFDLREKRVDYEINIGGDVILFWKVPREVKIKLNEKENSDIVINTQTKIYHKFYRFFLSNESYDTDERLEFYVGIDLDLDTIYAGGGVDINPILSKLDVVLNKLDSLYDVLYNRIWNILTTFDLYLGRLLDAVEDIKVAEFIGKTFELNPGEEFVLSKGGDHPNWSKFGVYNEGDKVLNIRFYKTETEYEVMELPGGGGFEVDRICGNKVSVYNPNDVAVKISYFRTTNLY